jgi:hypothetical protein
VAKQDLLKKLAARYRKNYPYLKFSVRRKKLSTDLGLTGFRNDDGTFIIELDTSYCPAVACFILAHEIAHCLTFSLCPGDKPHDKPFWEAYEKTYRIYEDFCDETNK